MKLALLTTPYITTETHLSNLEQFYLYKKKIKCYELAIGMRVDIDGADELLEKNSSNYFVSHEENLATIWNMGLKELFWDGFTHVLVTTPDVILHKDTPELIEETLLSLSFPGMVFLERSEDLTRFKARTHIGAAESIDRMDGSVFTFVISRDTFETVGDFDEVCNPMFFHDQDYFHRLKLTGFDLQQSKIPYYPLSSDLGAVSENAMEREKFKQAFIENAKYYQNKWGGLPGSERYTSPFDEEKLG